MKKIPSSFIHVLAWLLFYVCFMLYKYSKPEAHEGEKVKEKSSHHEE